MHLICFRNRNRIIPNTPSNIVGKFEYRCHHYVKSVPRKDWKKYSINNLKEPPGGDFPQIKMVYWIDNLKKRCTYPNR